MARKAFKTLCARHGDIEDWSEKLLDAAGDSSVKLLALRRRVKKLASSILSEVKEARISGQSMEDRMSAYREAIEELGFKRKKR